MNKFKGQRGEALSMALIILAMTLITDLSEPDLGDWLSFGLIILALGRIVWIFPSSE